MPKRSGSPSILPLLRSQTQAGVLERLMLHPERRYTVTELADLLEVTPMSVRRELHRLVDSGIVELERVGRVGLHRADDTSPLYGPLRELIERSVGVEALLRELLEAFPGVDSAAIFGSWASGRVDAQSDIDVLVVGEFDYPALGSSLIGLQQRVGREINMVAMRPGELQAQLAEGGGFARNLIESNMRLLVGDPREP